MPTSKEDQLREARAEIERLTSALVQLVGLIQPLLDRPYGIASDEDAIVVAQGILARVADSADEERK